VSHLHQNHVIHRDIKGQNVLLTDSAEVKLGKNSKVIASCYLTTVSKALKYINGDTLSSL